MWSATTEHDAWGGYNSSPYFLSGEDCIAERIIGD
jgi:hypothetical protein